MAQLNLRQLEVFRAVMTTGSATTAARELRITQPAVSHQIAQLEKDLGVTLFERDKGKLIATAKAELIFEEVVRAFFSIGRIVDAARDMREIGSGVLRIIAPESLLTGMLPDAIVQATEARPDIMFSLFVGHYDRVQEAVANRQVDLGIGRLPVDDRAVDVHPLATVESVCVLPRSHPLAAKKFIVADDLRGEVMCALARELSSAYRMSNTLASRGFRPRIRVITHSAGSSCAFIAAGLGVGVMNKLLAVQSRDPRLVIRPFAPAAKYTYVILTQKDAPLSPATHEFITLLRSTAMRLLGSAFDGPEASAAD